MSSKTILHKIRFKNFLSTGNSFSEITLDEKPNTLICGKNGVGKSTLLDAMNFVLYGKPYRKITKSQIVNSINKKDCMTEIEISKSGSSYLIRRGISPNVFEIHKDGELIPQEAGVSDYQALLETTVLGMNQKTFNQIVILGSANYTPFMQLSAGERRQFIEDLLDLNVFTQMNKVLKEEVEEFKQTKLALESSIREKTSEIRVLDNSRSTIESMASQNLDYIQRRIDHLKNEFKQDNEKMKDKIAELESLGEEKPIDAMTDQLDQMKGFVIKLKHSSETVSKDLHFYQHNDSCPTCSQDIAEQLRNSKIEEGRTKVEKNAVKIDQISEMMENLQVKMTERRNHNNQRNELSVAIKQIKQQMTKAMNEVQDLDNQKEQSKKTNTFDYKILNEANRQLTEMKNELDEMSKYSDVLSAAANLLKDGGIKAKVIKNFIPVLNESINHYLGRMNLFAEFEMDENFNETIKSRHRDGFSYESFSEGEKLRIDLALLFAWRMLARRRNSIDTNLLIMDEILDGSLDDQGVKDFLDVIKDLTTDCQAVIISHKDSVFDLFDRVIRVEKVSGFSEHSEEIQ